MSRIVTILKIPLLTALCCMIGTRLFAQYEYSLKHFNTNNGLPDNEVTALAMDYDGYLWIGTNTCLVRYDGSGFKTFVFDKTKGEYINIIMYAMTLPSDKKIMIKTRTKYVYSIENGSPVLFSNAKYPKGSAWTFVHGNFPTFSLFSKCYRSVFDSLPYRDIINLLPLNDRDFIIPIIDNRQFNYYRDGVRQATVAVKGQIKQFLVSGVHRFFLDEKNNLQLYDSATMQFNKINMDWGAIKKTDTEIKNVLFFSDPFSGKSFCCVHSTFYLLDFDAHQNKMLFIPQFSIPGNKHFWTGLLYDSLHASFFLSTLNEGFFQVKLKKIRTINLNDRLPKNINPDLTIHYSVVKTTDSTAVIPTGFQFTARDSGVGIKKLGNVFGNRETIGVLKDGSIIVSWLNYFSPKDGYRTEHIFNDSFAHYNNLQIQLVYPEGDSVWVSTNNAVFSVTKHTMQVLFDKKKNKADSNHCELHLFYRTGKEEALVSSIHGLFRMHTVPPYKMEGIPGMKDKFVHSISAYKDVLILSIYTYGLYVFKDERLYKVPIPVYPGGLELCNALYTDKNGYLWITTAKGLFKSLASSVVESALNPASVPPYFFYYGNENGLENTQFTGSGVPPYAALAGERLLSLL